MRWYELLVSVTRHISAYFNQHSESVIFLSIDANAPMGAHSRKQNRIKIKINEVGSEICLTFSQRSEEHRIQNHDHLVADIVYR